MNAYGPLSVLNGVEITPIGGIIPVSHLFLAIHSGCNSIYVERLGAHLVSSKLRGQCQLDLKKLQRFPGDETGSSVVPLTVPWGDLFLKRVFVGDWWSWDGFWMLMMMMMMVMMMTTDGVVQILED